MSSKTKTDDLDTFLLVKKRRNELLNAYESFFDKKIRKFSNGSNIEFNQRENLLNSSDQEILTRHLNLFLQDKHLLSQFLNLTEKRLNHVDDCLIAKSFLEFFEIILLNLSQNTTFYFKINNKNYQNLKFHFESDFVVNKLDKLNCCLNKIDKQEYVKISLSRSQDQSAKTLIEQAFDFYLIREFFECIIRILKINLHLKGNQVIEFIAERVEWTMDGIAKLNDVNRNDANSPDNEEILTNQQWSCANCTFLNDIDLKICAICSNPKNFLNSENNSIFYS